MSHASGRTATAVLGLLVAVCVVAIAVPVHAEVVPSGMKIEKVLDSANELSEVAQAPDGALWLLERTTGTIRVVRAGLDFASLTLSVGSACDSGLLGVAFAPDYGSSRRAFVFYVDTSYEAHVVEVFQFGSGLQVGDTLLDVGTTPGGCRPGGGIDVDSAGMLYVAVGDMGTSGDAQDDGTLQGKVLRMDLNAGTPVAEVYAKGFRDGQSLVVDPDGNVYMSDMGETTTVDDEINAVEPDGNYAWDVNSGDTGGAYDDPLVSYMPSVGAQGVTALTGNALGDGQEGSLIFACSDPSADDMRQAYLTSGSVDHVDTLYDPLGDIDGVPDAGCPKQFTTLTEGADGWLYGANMGNSPGVWRIYNDAPGPREVSAPGSPFHLTVAKSGSQIELGWENLGDVDSGFAGPTGGSNPRTYQVWEGTLASLQSGTYDHTSKTFTNGTANGPIRLEAAVTPGSGDRYYLISAKGENIEGSVGSASDGTLRQASYDYCTNIGYDPVLYWPQGGQVGTLCAPKWVDYDTGGELYLRDYNPHSPTYLQDITLSDWRGKVVRIDVSAVDCFYCNEQADIIHEVDQDFRDRDLVLVTVLTLIYSNRQVIPEPLCAHYIETWANTHGETSPILCDVDKNGLYGGDVSEQYWIGAGLGCGGTPQNFYVDQGGILYDFKCGGQLTASLISSDVSHKVNDPCISSCSVPDIPWDLDETCE